MCITLSLLLLQLVKPISSINFKSCSCSTLSVPDQKWLYWILAFSLLFTHKLKRASRPDGVSSRMLPDQSHHHLFKTNVSDNQHITLIFKSNDPFSLISRLSSIWLLLVCKYGGRRPGFRCGIWEQDYSWTKNHLVLFPLPCSCFDPASCGHNNGLEKRLWIFSFI